MTRYYKNFLFIPIIIMAFFIIPIAADASGCCSFYDIPCTGSDCTAKYEGPASGIGDILKSLAEAPKTIYEQWATPEQTYEIKCVDATSYNNCNSKAQDEGKRAMWWYISCDEILGCVDQTLNPHLEEPYKPKKIENLPDIEVTNPVCWPKHECEAECKTGNCWTGQEAECPPDRGYCLADITPVDLAVDIGGVAQVRDLGSYIALLYNYLIGALVIFAIVMIMYGGFRWITAGGDAGKIGEAKSTIVGAVVGLVLGLFSFTILNVINPALLRLEMPRVKRIRPIYFEVKPIRCEDYITPSECKNNSYNFNISIDEDGKQIGGCAWETYYIGTLPGGKKCVNNLKGKGYPGDICKDDGSCEEGKCIEVSYQLNPIALGSPKWCTNGELDMPCKWDTDCKEGLKCDTNLFACVGSTGRPERAGCTEDGHCASGFCQHSGLGVLCPEGICPSGSLEGTCKAGKAGHCFKDSECNEPQGFKCIKFQEELDIGSCCDPLSSKKDGHGCYTGCTGDKSCGEDGICDRGAATFLKKGTTDEAKRFISDWAGTCFKKGSSGDKCINDSGCMSGLTCGNYQTYSEGDPVVETFLLAPGGSGTVSFPVDKSGGDIVAEYDRIKIGVCQ